MTARTAAPVRLGGLIEGPLDTAEIGGGSAAALSDWCQRCELETGARFVLEVRGGRFSLLPDTLPTALAAPGFLERLTDCLDDLVRLFRPPARTRLTSTVHCERDLGSAVQQSLFTVTVTGIQRHERASDRFATVLATDANTRGWWCYRWALSAVVIAVIIAASKVDWPALAKSLRLWS